MIRQCWRSVLCMLLVLGAVGCREGKALPEPAVVVNKGGPRQRAIALLEQVAAALCREDRAALERFLVSDEDYREKVLPGSVPVGEPALHLPAAKLEFFTRHHRTRSDYALAALLPACRLGSLRLRRVELPDRVEHRRAYALFREPKLVFTDPNGQEVELRPGSVIDMDGHAHMLSYFVD